MGGAGPGVLGLSSRALWIPVGLALLIQALLFVTSQPEIVFDSASYMAQAESLAQTATARNAVGEPDTVRTPGYPLFLAAFLLTPAKYPGAIAAQRLLWVLVVWGATWATFRLTNRLAAAIVAGVITAIDLPAVQASGSIVTETLATVFVIAAVWIAYQSARSERVSVAAAAGMMAGIAALIRPVAILMALPLAVALLLCGTRAFRNRAAAVVVAVSVILPAIWTIRNYAQAGVVTFSSISSINMLMYRAAGTLAIRDPGGVDANIARRQAELEAIACQAAEARFAQPCHSIPIARRATLYTELALPILRADPVGVIMQAGRAFVMIMFGGGANVLSRATGIAESTARMAAFAYTVPLAILAAAGVIYWRRVDPLAAWLMLLTIAYLVVMSLGVEAYSRFRVPFLPLYAMLAGGGAAWLLDRLTVSASPSRPPHQ